MPADPTQLDHAQRKLVSKLVRAVPVATDLAARFAAAGHSLHLVGGSVRDALLQRLGTDLDLATSARPEQVLDIARGWADGVWELGREFGTIGLRKGRYTLEVTTYRADTYVPESRKPSVQFGDSLVGDLRRRDFTVNAMAVSLDNPAFVDPYGGLRDLAQRVLDTPASPEESFGDDPLRILRAARFVSVLSVPGKPFRVSDRVAAAMRAMASRLEIVSAERIQTELSKLVLGTDPRRALELLVDTGVAEIVLPELPRLRLAADPVHRHKDVYEHTLTVLDQAIALETNGPDLVLRLAALLHDIGKPKTRSFEPGGGVSFHHHEVVGRDMARARLSALRYPKQVVDDVARLVELHLRFHGYGGGEWTDSAVRRYVTDAGELLERLHKLVRSDCTTRNPRKAAALQATYDSLEMRIARLREQEELSRIRPDLDGNEIQQILGLRPGPMVGKARQYLLDLRLEEGPLGKDGARERLLAWAREQGITPPA